MPSGKGVCDLGNQLLGATQLVSDAGWSVAELPEYDSVDSGMDKASMVANK
ncbi:hypothetical protein [Bacterioplanes sanyensis]|uniref:hypothetical protein n=1 Tax=Bacterioplanes sanyensis TaxID=1249553 RepID=UPI0012FE5D23|nr:hypothetical protein [Bacterioplanes sanyensis]